MLGGGVMVEIKKMVKSSIVKKVLQINCTCDIYIPMGDLGMLKLGISEEKLKGALEREPFSLNDLLYILQNLCMKTYIEGIDMEEMVKNF